MGGCVSHSSSVLRALWYSPTFSFISPIVFSLALFHGRSHHSHTTQHLPTSITHLPSDHNLYVCVGVYAHLHSYISLTHAADVSRSHTFTGRWPHTSRESQSHGQPNQLKPSGSCYIITRGSSNQPLVMLIELTNTTEITC